MDYKITDKKEVFGLINIVNGIITCGASVYRLVDDININKEIKELFGVNIPGEIAWDIIVMTFITGLVCIMGGYITLKKKKWVWVIVGPICVIILFLFCAYKYLPIFN